MMGHVVVKSRVYAAFRLCVPLLKGLVWVWLERGSKDKIAKQWAVTRHGHLPNAHGTSSNINIVVEHIQNVMVASTIFHDDRQVILKFL